MTTTTKNKILRARDSYRALANAAPTNRPAKLRGRATAWEHVARILETSESQADLDRADAARWEARRASAQWAAQWAAARRAAAQ